jgi:zinc transport system permease protein
MIEIFLLPFMQRALLGGILVGFLASYYGVFIVQRGMSFMGDGLAHAAFGGIALGLLLKTEPLWVAIPFTIVVSIGITWVREHTKLGSDTSVGIFFSISMALGIVFLFLRDEYTDNAFTYLFGSILAVNWIDVLSTIVIVILTIIFFPFWKRWAYTSFDRELAQADRLHITRDDYILSIMVAITVVISIKVVGIVLIASFLVIPAATARIITATFKAMTIVSVILGILSAIIGLIFSYYLDIPSGATIILLQAVLFFLAMLTGLIKRK